MHFAGPGIAEYSIFTIQEYPNPNGLKTCILGVLYVRQTSRCALHDTTPSRSTIAATGFSSSLCKNNSAKGANPFPLMLNIPQKPWFSRGFALILGPFQPFQGTFILGGWGYCKMLQAAHSVHGATSSLLTERSHASSKLGSHGAAQHPALQDLLRHSKRCSSPVLRRRQSATKTRHWRQYPKKIEKSLVIIVHFLYHISLVIYYFRLFW